MSGIAREEPYDIAIKGGVALVSGACECLTDVLEDAFVGIRRGKIVRICPAAEVGEFAAAEIIKAQGMVIIPGLINTHCHAAMTHFRGFADDLPLSEWLFHRIFPAERRVINAETVYHGARLAFAEMLLAGVTTVADSYFFTNSSARAAQELGIRLVLCQGYFDPPARADVATMEATARDFLARWRDASPMIFPALFCHSLYTCSPLTLARIKNVAREHGAPFMFHLLETPTEAEMVYEKYGAKVLNILTSSDLLDENTLAVHCVYLDAELREIFAARGVKVAHNPHSNMKLACGVAPLPQVLAAGICVGLGTDGAASNNRLDMFAEMGAAAKLHKAASLTATAISAPEALRMATLAGARALGLDALIGSLTVGKRADVVVLDFRKPHLTPVYDYCSHLVYCARASDVHTTIVDGRVLVRDGALCNGDINAIMGAVGRVEMDYADEV